MPETVTTLPWPRPNPEADTYGRHATTHPDDLPNLPVDAKVTPQRGGGSRRTEREPLTYREFKGRLADGKYTR